VAARSNGFERLVKGNATPVIEDGVVCAQILRRHDLSLEDLREDLRLEGVTDPTHARRAQLERNGEISVERR
jgi:uncharacterized membrane protein YcaP (DUF421 family)